MVSAIALALLLIFGASEAAFGQRGHGKDRDRGEGRGGEHRERGEGRGGDHGRKWEGRGDDGGRRDWKENRRERREEFRAERRDDRDSWRDQRREWKHERRDGDRRERQWNVRADRRDDDNDRRHERREWRENRRENRRQVYVRQQPTWESVWYGSQNDWRGDRYVRHARRDRWRDERNEWKERRKEWKEDWKERRKEWREERKESRKFARQYWRNRRGDWDRDRYTYYSDDDRYYYSDDDRYYGGSNWTQQLLGRVLSGFLGGQTGGDYYNAAPQYNDYYYNSVPNVYSYNRGSQYYYNGQPQYYNNQVPNSYAYYPEQNYSGYPQYDGYGLTDGLFGQIPYFDLADQYTGGLATQMLQQALNYGYERGLLAGQAARYNGIGDDNYYDPYSYQNAGYDDGYSLSLDQNRQYLSDGYRLGYLDALNGRSEYDPQPNGDVDLVGLLLNGVLSSGIL